ncbi:DnaA N-terminal domain-containing protein [Falsigemmobacter faecalis]|uniref:DnaA N-terminal domain-containing protein n=1 Tax=Falsigemmobacter faecalis TaxID=2488730 RepID=A0A3P3DVT8_9RHOB|nr:DnaA N-terminal domain-containing protein [Falsigemmobacter faecalis]RRH78251.1 hypothetical protein EG244_02060 [Falsigemmobacter faecalis]
MTRATGAALSAVQKYDLLTALGAWGLSQDRTLQRQVLRLICLITAHYNWQEDRLSVSQLLIAKLWSVDVRTVKRELAAIRERGWLYEKRRSVRGQAAWLGLDVTRILADTAETWEVSGTALARRLQKPAPVAVTAVEEKVIAFPQIGNTRWGRIARVLAEQDRAVWQAWFAGLTPICEEGELILRAPSGFHASYVQTHYLTRLEHLWGGPVRLQA